MSEQVSTKNGRPIYQEGTEGWKLYALFDEKQPRNRQEAMAYASEAGINENSGSANFYQWRIPTIEQTPAYEVFTTKDEDYRAWLKTHPQGYVLNSYSRPNPKYLVLHRAWCSSIENIIGVDYLKVCANSEKGLWQWLNEKGFAEFSSKGHSCNKQKNDKQKNTSVEALTPPHKGNTIVTTPIALNQILFGPPGTGKTYNTINKALEVLDPEFLSVNSEDRLALKNRFDDFIEDERIVFCTFHQSFSYEDFIEGLRASSIDGQIEYRVESGVFKKICERATWISNKDLMGKDFSYEASIDDALDKFVTRVSVRPIILETQSGLLFHVNYVGWDKGLYCTTQNNIIKLSVDNLRKILNGIESVLESSTDAPFTSRILEYIKEKLLDNGGALDNSSLIFGAKKPYVLIIDEINRGNISKIFGELITLIEPSKRAGRDEALSVILPYSKESFSAPDNVYLIGTMNTADRSLASLDIALRRCFEFVEMPPRPDLLNNKIISGVNIGELLKVMNERIEILLGREHCLGHAYFMALPENASVEDLADIFRRQIIPLLQEYFFEDWQRISWVLNDPRKMLANRFLVQSQSNVLQLFGDEVGSALQDNRWLISKEAFERIEAYAGVINHEAKTTVSVVGRQVFFMGHTVRQLESGTIELLNGEEIITPVMPKLKEMAESLSIGILNGQDQPYNTRQLGKVIIDAVEALV